MKHIYNKVLTGLGVVLSIYGLVLSAISNFNLGVVLVLALGLLAIITGLFYESIKEHTRTGPLRCLKVFVVTILCFEFVLVSFITIYGVCDDVSYNEDAVIVLGAGIMGERITLPLKTRLDKAVEYHTKNPSAVIVVSGGQGFQETVTEAYAMKKYLVQHGVDKDKIIMEERATSTMENMLFSKALLDKHFYDDYSVVVITNNFHIFRGVSLAKKSGFTNIKHIHSGLQWYNLMPCYLRESLAVLKMLVFD